MPTKKTVDKENKAELHHDHRKRVKESFRVTGLNGLHDHNVLEILLFYSIPRADTNATAHLLLDEFGSFTSIFEASIDELKEVDGIGIESATFIRFLAEFMKYYEMAKVRDCNIKYISDSDTAAKILKPNFKAINYEKFVVLFLNGKGGIITQFEFTQHSSDSVQANLKTIFQKAVLLQAQGIILAHNHPNGFAVPSKEDIELTVQFAENCKTLDIVLCDHIIFSGNDYTCISKTKGVKKNLCAF